LKLMEPSSPRKKATGRYAVGDVLSLIDDFFDEFQCKGDFFFGFCGGNGDDGLFGEEAGATGVPEIWVALALDGENRVKHYGGDFHGD